MKSLHRAGALALVLLAAALLCGCASRCGHFMGCFN